MDPLHLDGRRQAERRRLLKMSLLGGLGAAVPALAARAQDDAAPPDPAPISPAPGATVAIPDLPVVDARFPHEVAPGIFLVPDRRVLLVPNIGIVVGTESALVIDCGLGIESAEAVLALARELAPGRRLILTMTHAHPEHGFGAQVFGPDATIFYNRAQAEHLARSGPALLDGFRTRTLPPAYAHVLDGVELVPPDEVWEGARQELDLGGRRVEFLAWGTAHSPGDQVIHLSGEVPGGGIVFAGDLIEERMFPIMPFFPPMISAEDIDAAQWEVVLAEIEALGPAMIVPGHGNLAGPEVARDVGAYLREVRGLVEASRGSPERLEMIEQQVRAMHPTWENSQYIAPAVSYFAQARP